MTGFYDVVLSILRPVSTKPFFLTYVKWETDVHRTNWLIGHGPFANRPADVHG